MKQLKISVVHLDVHTAADVHTAEAQSEQTLINKCLQAARKANQIFLLHTLRVN